MKVNRTRQSALVILLVAALAGCGTTPSGEENKSGDGLRKVVLANDGTAAAAAVSLGIDHGFFKDEGLSVEDKGIGAPPAIIAAVQSGQVTAGSVPTIALINAIGQGVPLKAFAPDSGYPSGVEDMKKFDTIGIYVNPEARIQRPRDLEGKSVAVPSRKAVFEVLVADAVRRDGGDPAKVNWIVLDFGSQVAALKGGKVDAAGLPMPFTVQASQAGAKLLVQPGQAFYETGPTNVWAAGPTTAQDPELVASLQRAIQKSNDYANEHRDETMARAAKLTGIDLATIEASPGFNYFPSRLDAKDILRTRDKLVDMGYLDHTVDLSGSLLEPKP